MLTEVVVVMTPVRVMVVVKVARQVLTVHTGDGHHWREHTASLIKTPEMYTRHPEKFKVEHANTNRFKNSAIIYTLLFAIISC